MKRYKAIFGNPPYSIKTGVGQREKKNLWPLFSETSIEMADEVYYITPLIWNKKSSKFIKLADDSISKIDINIGKYFDIGSTMCYWNTHKENETFIHTKNKKIEIDKISEIRYIPFDIDNTLSIHRKGWQKKPIEIKRTNTISYEDDKFLLHRERDEEYKYPVFSTTLKFLYYTNEKGLSDYGVELFNTPKILVGRTKHSIPVFDRVGEYANTHLACVLVDTIPNLEIRFKQLQSKFYKFWFATGRPEIDRRPDGFLYTATFKLFPDIPLHITEDADIYEWLGLTDDEILIVEKYGDACDTKKFWWKTPKKDLIDEKV